MTQQSNQPNHFELTGTAATTDEQVQIIYDVTAIDGQPHLTYQDSRGSRTFIGNQIRSQNSELGTELSVTLIPSVDAGVSILTLLLPSINMRGMTERPYQTLAITTQSFGILLHDSPDLTYSVLNLQGTAQIVES